MYNSKVKSDVKIPNVEDFPLIVETVNGFLLGIEASFRMEIDRLKSEEKKGGGE